MIFPGWFLIAAFYVQLLLSHLTNNRGQTLDSEKKQTILNK